MLWILFCVQFVFCSPSFSDHSSFEVPCTETRGLETSPKEEKTLIRCKITSTGESNAQRAIWETQNVPPAISLT